MREIKFRQPVFDRKGNFLHFHYWGWMSKGVFVSPLSMGHNVKEVLGDQYTGLKDGNDVEIYEGDVEEFGNQFKERITFAAFEYSCGCCSTVFGYKLHDHYSVVDGVIIGNIHQNPELLGNHDSSH